jgi:hypothetical protein
MILNSPPEKTLRPGGFALNKTRQSKDASFCAKFTLHPPPVLEVGKYIV